MAGVFPETVYNYLKGMRYPAKKQDLIMQAKKNEAGPDVIGALETLPDQEFKSQNELIRIGSELKHR